MMRPRLTLCLCVPAFLFASVDAWAQTAQPASVPDTSVTRIEVGGGVIVPAALGGYPIPSVDTRLNLTSGTAFEVAAHLATTRSGLDGLYTLSVHQDVGRLAHEWRPFVTAMVLGSFEYRRVAAYQTRQRETGDTIMSASYSRGRVTRPFGVGGGGGVRKTLGRRVAFEAGAQLWFAEGGVVVVPGAALTFSIGRAR